MIITESLVKTNSNAKEQREQSAGLVARRNRQVACSTGQWSASEAEQ
jgi:hypothetical protein